MLERFYSDQTPGAGIVFFEGMFSASLGSLGALLLLPDQVGLVSIFLCAIASLDSVQRQLDWNRRAILEQGQEPQRVNGLFTLRLSSLFAGQFIAFSVMALVLSPGVLSSAFSYQIGDFSEMSFPAMVFPAPIYVLGHNLSVLCLFFLLALLFRHGGALLAVSWNASVWGVVFGWLARQWALEGGPLLPEAYVRVLLGVLPHMVLEAVGYTLAAFAGVFLSLALARTDTTSTYWDGLSKTLMLMLTLAVLAVAVGAVIEGAVAPVWITFLARTQA